MTSIKSQRGFLWPVMIWGFAALLGSAVRYLFKMAFVLVIPMLVATFFSVVAYTGVDVALHNIMDYMGEVTLGISAEPVKQVFDTLRVMEAISLIISAHIFSVAKRMAFFGLKVGYAKTIWERF